MFLLKMFKQTFSAESCLAHVSHFYHSLYQITYVVIVMINLWKYCQVGMELSVSFVHSVLVNDYFHIFYCNVTLYVMILNCQEKYNLIVNCREMWSRHTTAVPASL